MISKDPHFNLQNIANQICKEGFCNRPQLILAIWQAAKKVISNNSQQSKQTLLANSFYGRVNKELGKFSYSLQPTESLLIECGLKYRSQIRENEASIIPITQINLYKNMSSPEKQYFKSDKELIVRFFYLLINKMRELIKQNKTVEIDLEQFGTMKINEKTYFFEPFIFADKGSYSSPNLLKFKRTSKSKKQNSSFDKADESKFTSKFYDSINQDMATPRIKKRPYFHQAVVQNQPNNTRICNDLLGAGIDPLTYDYQYSKMIEQTSELISQDFTRPQHSYGRLPCVIDKFSRTKGTQLTGVKVGNSIVVRIGGNYSPNVRNYYIDIKSKSIQYVVPQTKIKLESNKQLAILPATQAQQYTFLQGKKSKQLQSRVALRKQIYQRYCQYYKNNIPNDCVAQLERPCIERIINQVKNLVKKIGKKDGSPLINSLISEVNTEYYLAYKKSVLDYILKDKSQMVRTGIGLIFTTAGQWGKPNSRKNATAAYPEVNLKQLKRNLQLNHILYPQCLNKIYHENQKITNIQLFKKRREGEFRPYNILYYIKRNTNQLNESYGILCDGWAKKITSIIQQSINLKQQNYQKVKQFFNSVHIIMSNKLKEIIYNTIEDIINEFNMFESIKQKDSSKNLLIINLTEEFEKITFIDDIQKVLQFELLDIVHKIIETTKQIPRVQNYLKIANDLTIWGVDQNDSYLINIQKRLKVIVDQNYKKVQLLKAQLSKFEKIFAFRDQVTTWCRQNFNVQFLNQKFKQIEEFQKEVYQINFYYKVNMVIVDCIQLKKKLIMQLRNIKKTLFDTTQQKIKTKNQSILSRINSSIQLVCKNVSTTAQFVELSHDIQKIKHEEMHKIKAEIDHNLKDIMYMFNIEGFSANFELIKSSYLCKHYYQELFSQVNRNEKRLFQERMQLQKKLREKISIFQAETFSCLKQINSKIDTFDMRKLYSDYLGILAQFKNKVQNNKQIQKQLNTQQEDLKWVCTAFTHAKALQNIVEPNFQLWQLVSQFDTCIKEWKYIELSRFDIENGQKKINLIDNKITKLITRLKNFSGLKIVYDLQNDVKEFLGQQVSIIRIFSNPGLKQRHWNLFNKRLPLSGYDLKQFTYGRIKMLYQYQKNLKVLMSISNQAAKQFEIQNQKQEMFGYWNKLNFQLDHVSDQNIIFINEDFLDEQIEIVEHQITKTVILKNSPFSKALVTLLTQWENWLMHAKKILAGFGNSQGKFKVVRSIFKMDEISKLLPIQSTEFDSIENIWKSVIKKILEQPKITQFFKSQKMPDIIDQIGKKADFIKNSFNSYLNLKRSQFNRMYFVPAKSVLHLIQLLALDQLQPALQFIAWTCFNGLSRCTKNDNSTLLIGGLCDSIIIKCEINPSKKGKSKFFQELIFIEKNMRETIKLQIKELNNCDEIIQSTEKKYTLTSIFTALEIQFALLLKSHQNLKNLQKKYLEIKENLIKKLRRHSNLKHQILLQKIIFMQQRCQQLNIKSSESNLQQIPLFCYNAQDLQVKFLNQSIKYHYQYVGDEITPFIPLSSDKLIWQIAYSMNSHVGLVCPFSESIKQIAHFTGQYFAEVNNPLHIEEDNFQSCIVGAVCTNYWIHFDDKILSMTFEMISKLTEIYQLKKEKTDLNICTLTIKNSEVNINKQTMVFLSILPNRQQQIPQGLLTCTRSISLLTPPLFVIKQLAKQNNKLSALKSYLFILKYKCKNIRASQILKTIQPLNDVNQCIQSVKNNIWIHLQLEHQQQFLHLFANQQEVKQQHQPKQWKSYLKQKQNEINYGLSWSDLVFVVGQRSGKSQIIKSVFKSKEITELYSENKGINLNFIEPGVSELSYISYLQKAKNKIMKELEDIYLYIDCDLKSSQVQAIKHFMYMHSLSHQHQRRLKIIVQINSLAQIDPSLICHSCVININELQWQNFEFYKQWVRKLTISSEDRTIILQLQNAFQVFLKLVIKMEKRPFNDSKYTLAKRFFGFFQIFLNSLNSKQVQRMCQLQKDSFIFNSFIYSIYWAFGVSTLRSNQVQGLKKKIKQLYGERLEMPGELQEIYLNGDNEWVYWQNLKEEFVSQKQNLPFYQIWVPTASNTKLLTMLVKLIENNHSILIIGSQSGKSTLLNEISSFQLSYNSFLIDCHKHTSISHVTNLTRGRILYGEFKKNLILVDDLHLPIPEICDILRCFTEKGYTLNPSPIGKLNESLWKPSILATWNGYELNRCFWRFYNKTIPIQLQKYEFKELQSILKTYLNCLIPSNQAYSNFFRLQTVIVNYCIHTIKVFPMVEPHHLRMIIESICRLNLEKGQKYILEHLLVESYFVVQQLIPNQQLTHFFRHMSHYYSKLLSIQLKNYAELKEIADNYLYDLKNQKQVTQNKVTLEEMSLWVEQKIKEKNNELLISNFHIKIMQRIAWILKNNNSHVVILSSISNGCKSMARMAGRLIGITVNQLKNINVSGVLEDVVKVLKTGGKIDQSINIISHELINSQPNLIKLVHSLIFSPEFHECFGQILMEQIIKSFNSEKKFLKKNVKKSELIKKIREKFNSIYHFCLCVQKAKFKALLDDYPKFCSLRVIQMEQWPVQALVSVSRKFMDERSDQVVKIMLKIDEEIRMKWQKISGKSPNNKILKMMGLYSKVQKFLNLRVTNIEQNDQLWSKRVKSSKEKIENLQKQKLMYQVQHSQYFENMNNLNQQIANHKSELQNLKQHSSNLEKQLQIVKSECNSFKGQFQLHDDQLHNQYRKFVDQKNELILKQAEKYRINQNFQKMASAYGFSLEKIEQSIIQLAYQLQEDYFFKLRQVNCGNLGILTTLITKFSLKMSQQWQKQSELSEKFKKSSEIQTKLQQYEQNIRYIQDIISDLNDDLSNLKQSRDSVSKGYEEINQKILQNEAIINILNKFQHVLRFKNDINPPPAKQLIGHCILMTYLISYLPLLAQNQINHFESMIISNLSQFKVNISSLQFLSFFAQQKQFELVYKQKSNIDDWLKLLAFYSKDLCVVAIGKIKEITRWVNKTAVNKTIVWLKSIQDLRDCLQKDNIIYINHPSKALFQQLIYLLLRPISVKNNLKNLIVDDEDISIHESCRVVFIYETWQLIPIELLMRNYYILTFSDKQNKKIESALEQKLIRRQSMSGDRQSLVDRYLKVRGQIGILNQKLHAVILKMKRENMMSQLVFKKIQEEGESKIALEAEMDGIKAQLIAINKIVDCSSYYVEQLSKIYTKFRNNLPIESYVDLISIVLQGNDLKDFQKVVDVIQNYLNILLNQSIQTAYQSQFQTLTLKLVTSGRVVVILPDLSKGLEILQQILHLNHYQINRIFAEDLIPSILKDNMINITAISRAEQMKQFAYFYESNKDKIKNAKIILFVLDYINLAPQVQENSLILPFKNLKKYFLNYLQNKSQPRNIKQLVNHSKINLRTYQHLIDYSKLLDDKQKKNQVELKQLLFLND